ncbi:MAG: sigma-70 family RNA polymerase sigma factor [Clostridiales bacterium]|nr:sigma-70 family RNA polymerase sigma factor [Clostridiales bacterium]
MTDEEFFNKIELIRRKMFAVAFPYFKSESIAIDMVDEAIYKGFLKKRSLREETFFETWMIRILMNTCATHYKRSLRYQSFDECVLESNSTTSFSEEKMELVSAVSSLPDDLRKVITLRYFGGYSMQELSDMLKIPIGTVSSRTRRAIEELRRELGGEF